MSGIMQMMMAGGGGPGNTHVLIVSTYSAGFSYFTFTPSTILGAGPITSYVTDSGGQVNGLTLRLSATFSQNAFVSMTIAGVTLLTANAVFSSGGTSYWSWTGLDFSGNFPAGVISIPFAIA